MSSKPSSSRLLSAADTLLLVVDIQERFEAAIPHFAQVVSRTQIMLQACERLGLSVVASEQYPKGLGHTSSELTRLFPPGTVVFEKTTFGCFGDTGIEAHLQRQDKPQIMVCGIETHVCVNQTVHQLLTAGYQVHLLQDAMASRKAEDHTVGLAKMHQAGAIPSCVEMAIFEMVGNARHTSFKDLIALIK